jgi:CRISPR-associated protein (TIGR02710 family)
MKESFSIPGNDSFGTMMEYPIGLTVNRSMNVDFSTQLQQFRERVGNRQAVALILAGSRQEDTAALLIGALQPKRVAFLLTPETHDFLEKVAAKLDREPDPTWIKRIAHYTDVNQVYRELRAVIEEWCDLDRDQILVDLTAGTKPMTVGLAKAAYVLGLGTIYIESDYEQNQVVPGSQRLIDPSDPYEVFGDLEAAQARRLFNAHDYVNSERIYRDLAQRVKENKGYEQLALLARAYAQWDTFGLAAAAETMAQLLAQSLITELRVQQRLLEAQRDAISRLLRTTQAMRYSNTDLSTLADADAILPLLGSLHANALRREAQRRYDTAALLHYRSLELMSQHRLATHGVLAEHPDLDRLKQRQPQLENEYRAVERSLGFRERGLQPNRDGRYNPITLLNGYMLLKALQDPLVQSVNLADIQNRVSVRNKSILAHGFRQITETEYRDFVSVVEQVLDQFFAIIAHKRENWEKLYRFIKL